MKPRADEAKHDAGGEEMLPRLVRVNERGEDEFIGSISASSIVFPSQPPPATAISDAGRRRQVESQDYKSLSDYKNGITDAILCG
ncbi:hypothetical protein BDQ17DRAFT_1439828 [Cyathus striatus]|nr:hypothetical protein BDQ17DRAFT_1439828 [Cyathus striatus]